MARAPKPDDDATDEPAREGPQERMERTEREMHEADAYLSACPPEEKAAVRAKWCKLKNELGEARKAWNYYSAGMR